MKPPPRPAALILALALAAAPGASLVLTWDQENNDQLHRQAVVWDCAAQRMLTQYTAIEVCTNLPGPWITLAVTQRPPVVVQAAGPRAFFRARYWYD